MELKFRGQFNRDIYDGNKAVLEAVRDTIFNVKQAKDVSQIHNLKKLNKYKIHYRIKVANDYRIGVIIKANKVWFLRFGHRSLFYKKIISLKKQYLRFCI